MVSWRQKAYEELPALSVRGPELRRTLRLVTLAWMFGITWMTCINGSRMNYFARMVGFGNFHFGLMGALPFIAKFLQLGASVIIERTGMRKYQFITCMSIQRLLWAAVALVPLFMPVPSAGATWLILGILAVSWAFESMGAPAWQTWMGDIIPKRIRGRYLASRGYLARLVQIPVMVVLAVYIAATLDKNAPMTPQAQPFLMYSLVAVFLLASICGLIDILLFRRIREVLPPVREEDQGDSSRHRLAEGKNSPRPIAKAPSAVSDFLGVLLIPLKDEQFRKLALYGTVMTFAQIVAAPFFIRHLIEAVGMGPVAVDFLFMGLGPVVAMFAVRFLGRLVDRWGRRPVMVASQLLTIFSVLPYFFVSAQTPDPAWLTSLGNEIAGRIGGLFGADWSGTFNDARLGATLIMSTSLILGSIGWSGVMLALGTIIFGFSDGKGRSRYVSAFAVFTAIGGVIGGLAGGLLASALSHFSWDQSPWILGPFILNNWHAVFLLSFLARIASLLLVSRLPDPGSGSVRAMIRHMGSSIYSGLSTRFNSPMRIWPSRHRMQRKKALVQAKRRQNRRRNKAA